MQKLKGKIRKWFEDYTGNYTKGEDQENIILKIEHSKRVAKDIGLICVGLELNEYDRDLAEICGILHDVGRFEQYKRYKTFNDAHSVNHAELGVQVIIEQRILKELPEIEQNLILKAISYHNRLDLPVDEDESILYFSKILRDGDKLDIFKVVTDYYAVRSKKRNETLELELPDEGDITDIVYDAVLQGRIVDYRKIKNLNDFKLLQVGWVYGLNFLPSIKLFDEREYLGKLQAALPDNEKCRAIFNQVRNYIVRRLQDEETRLTG